MPHPPRRFGAPRVAAFPDPSVRSSPAPEMRPYTGLPFSQSSSSPSAPGHPPSSLTAAVGASVSGVPRSPSVRLERSGLTLFEERALRAEARNNANDAAIAYGKLRELIPRLRAMEKATEELADIKAAAMTSTTQLAEAEARFRRADHQQRAHEKSGDAADSGRAVLVEKLRVAEAEVESLKNQRLEEARAFVEKCRADEAKIPELTEMLEKELEGRSTVSKRDFTRKVGDSLLLEEELRLLKEEMGRLRLANANRAAEQQELAALRTRLGEQTRAIERKIGAYVGRANLGKCSVRPGSWRAQFHLTITLRIESAPHQNLSDVRPLECLIHAHRIESQIMGEHKLPVSQTLASLRVPAQSLSRYSINSCELVHFELDLTHPPLLGRYCNGLARFQGQIRFSRNDGRVVCSIRPGTLETRSTSVPEDTAEEDADATPAPKKGSRR
ncbi:MAG: hypothetical protein M1826_007287 [Phylliscum demangeonii]|nr:MAG: hypothetical protein M1826_007287 [Phylliscum demangeonii]